MAHYQIHQGNNQDTLKQYHDNHFDAIITDPPYGIEFLGKDWDANTGAVATWKECFRVLKPGGYLLAFSAARTYHHLASNIESVGFEIRDQLMWLYASGFPKAQDVGKGIEKRGADGTEWSGWKTALKPAHEPIVMARKPFKGSTIDNVLSHGVGALNIDESRIPWDKEPKSSKRGTYKDATVFPDGCGFQPGETPELNEQGRFPSNVLGEIEGYQKFFYCPKVSRKERHCGFEAPTANGTTKMYGKEQAVVRKTTNYNGGNNHPTVKPVALMRYLIELVAPKNSVILDPFTGSGSTGMAACELGHTFVGCELDPHYVSIARKRIEGWCKPQEHHSTYKDLFEDE